MFGLYDQYSRILITNFTDCPVLVAKVTAALLSGELYLGGGILRLFENLVGLLA